MNCYEHTFIAKQDLPSSQTKTLVNKYEDIIKKNSGKVLKTEEWGLRNLSHIIKNNKKGFYFHIKFEGIGTTINEVENEINLLPKGEICEIPIVTNNRGDIYNSTKFIF